MLAFHAHCKPCGWSSSHVPDDVARDALVGHMADHHHRRPMRAPSMRGASWRMPKPRPLTIAVGDVGDDVTWVDTATGVTRHGQVWANSPRRDARWVADGREFVEVHVEQFLRVGRAVA